MEHEKDLLTEVTKLRTEANNPNISDTHKINLDKKLSAALGSIMVAVENYPELQASENIMHLQKSLHEIEEQISAARRAYNQAVTDYNDAIEMFPTNFIAKVMNYRTKHLFEIIDAERQNVDVKELFKS